VNRRHLPNLGLDRFSAIYLWVIFIVVFGAWSPGEFLTRATFQSVASSQSIAGVLAIAVLVPLVCGQFDLSVGATANLTGIVVILLQTSQHWGVIPSVVLSVIIGVAVGAVNGFVVVKLRVNSFIATLGMSSVLSAADIIVTNSNEPPPVSTAAWVDFTQTEVLGVQIVVVYLLALGLLVWWLLAHTPVGRYMYATGGNAEAARLSGVRVGRWSWISLTIAGGIAGLGGVLFSSLTGPSLTFGATLLLPAFAAAFLGSTQLQPGRFNVWGTLIAIYVLATGVEGLELVSGQQWLSDMFNGVALIAAVALAVWRQRRTEHRPSSVPHGTSSHPDIQVHDSTQVSTEVPEVATRSQA
jgi:ribose transport system permease protein